MCKQCVITNSGLSHARNPERSRENRRHHKATVLGRFTQGKFNAKKKGVSWNLTLEQYTELISRPCIYGNQPLTYSKTGIGLDQKIPGRGYTKNNALPCCPYHNALKNAHWTYKEMKRLLVLFPRHAVCGVQRSLFWSEKRRKKNERIANTEKMGGLEKGSP